MWHRVYHLRFVMLLCLSWPAQADLFRADSKRPDAKMDIVITEIERQPRTSLLEIKIKNIGSSVGSSFFLLCSVRELARQRGNFQHIVKIEGQLSRGHMLVGFLRSAEEDPVLLDARFAGQKPIALEQFGAICDRMQ